MVFETLNPGQYWSSLKDMAIDGEANAQLAVKAMYNLLEELNVDDSMAEIVLRAMDVRSEVKFDTRDQRLAKIETIVTRYRELLEELR